MTRALPRGRHIEEIPGESKTSKLLRKTLPRPDAKSLRLVLFQPDIPQNAGALMRLAACLGVAVDIIEPCGFVLSDRRMKRAGLDYLDLATVTCHSSWTAYHEAMSGRLLLLTTGGDIRHCDFLYNPGDSLMVGRESAGVPQEVHDVCDARLRIPMRSGLRSLNVATAAALVLGEALRQTGLFPEGEA